MRASSIAGATGGQALRIRHGRILRVNRKSGNLPELVEADALRARECGETPRSIREAFFIARENILAASAARRRIFVMALTLTCGVFACGVCDALAAETHLQQS